MAKLVGCQCAEDAAPPGACAQVVLGLIGARRQSLGHGEAQRQAEGGIEPEHGQCLAQVFYAAATGVQRRIGDAQHPRAEPHVQTNDLCGRCQVGFRVLRQFDHAQGNARR